MKKRSYSFHLYRIGYCLIILGPAMPRPLAIFQKAVSAFVLFFLNLRQISRILSFNSSPCPDSFFYNHYEFFSIILFFQKDQKATSSFFFLILSCSFFSNWRRREGQQDELKYLIFYHSFGLLIFVSGIGSGN